MRPLFSSSKRLVQVVHAGNIGAVLLSQLSVGAGDGVGGLFVLQIFQAVDGVVITLGDDGGAVVGVRLGEVVFLGALSVMSTPLTMMS